MRQATIGCCALLALAAWTTEAAADYIFGRDIQTTFFLPVNNSDNPGIRLELSIVVDPDDDLLKPLLRPFVTPADVGKTFIADPGTPNFARNVDVLLNGANDRIFVAQKDGTGWSGGWGADGWYEAEFLFGTPHAPVSLPRYDLQGATIDRAAMEILDFKPVAGPPVVDGWALFQVTSRVTFEGTPFASPGTGPGGTPADSPEPLSAATAVVGALGLMAARRRRAARTSTA